MTYEHFDPPFRDAKKHLAEGITLLCGSHQLESTKGLLSRDTIAKFNVLPRCRERGYASHPLDLGSQRPTLLIGGADMTNCGSGIAFNGRWLFRVREPEAHSVRWRLSAKFLSSSGTIVCEIRDNELVLPNTQFEIEQVARAITIRSDEEIVLELEFSPPAIVSINRYAIHVADGLIFAGRRSSANPFSGKQENRSVLEFRHRSGSTQTFTNCGFHSDVGLNLCLENEALVFRSQAVT